MLNSQISSMHSSSQHTMSMLWPACKQRCSTCSLVSQGVAELLRTLLGVHKMHRCLNKIVQDLLEQLHEASGQLLKLAHERDQLQRQLAQDLQGPSGSSPSPALLPQVSRCSAHAHHWA